MDIVFWKKQLLFTRACVREHMYFSYTLSYRPFSTWEVSILLNGLQFHFSTFEGVVMSSKSVPVNSVRMRVMLSTVIQSVKVWPMTVTIPPGSFIWNSAVATPNVIVVIFGRKLHSTVERTKKRYTWYRLQNKAKSTSMRITTKTPAKMKKKIEDENLKYD